MPCGQRCSAMADGATVPAVAAALLGVPVRSFARAGAGGNNRVYRLDTDAARYACKWYPPLAGDPRDRLAAEFGALRFFAAAGIEATPRAIAADAERRCAIYEWIEGRAVVPGAAPLGAMLDLLARLHRARGEADAAQLPAAAEAVTSRAELEAQIGRRLDRLQAVAPAEPALARFLAGPVRQLAERIRAGSGADPGSGGRTLSPADFGTHNMLERPGGRFAFIDFEYFGWDDPVSLVCDVLWHPAMQLSEPLAGQFLAGVADIYGDDASYAKRLHARFPAFGLRWALIVLNEYLPAHWERRRQAGAPDDWTAAKSRQLERAAAMVSRARTALDGGPWSG
jgi:hypothetical protein